MRAAQLLGDDELDALEDCIAVCRGAWARVTIYPFRHWAPQTFYRQVPHAGCRARSVYHGDEVLYLMVLATGSY